MMALAFVPLLLGWALGQSFRVLILVPAGILVIVLVLGLSIFLNDSPLQIAIKLVAINVTLPLGYVLGQTVFNVPSILRHLRKTRAGREHGRAHGITGLRTWHR
jgi:hypothetical protein